MTTSLVWVEHEEGQLKDATLETGLRVRVPPFIEIGEVIRVNTESGDYLSRA